MTRTLAVSEAMPAKVEDDAVTTPLALKSEERAAEIRLAYAPEERLLEADDFLRALVQPAQVELSRGVTLPSLTKAPRTSP